MGQEYRGCQMFFIDSADVGSKPCVYFLGAYDLILLSKGLPVCNVLRLLEPPPGTVSVMRVVYVECLARSFVLRKGFPRWHPKTELQGASGTPDSRDAIPNTPGLRQAPFTYDVRGNGSFAPKQAPSLALVSDNSLSP